MRRREFITLFGSAAAWPFAVRAQQAGKIHRIGMLEALPATRNSANLNALRNGLRNLGYVEGQNLVIEYRSADGRAERFPDLASELVGLNLDLILARGTPATTAVQNATGTIPVVMVTMGGPGAIVASFAHPSSNITGVITFSTELTAKRVEILKELVPRLSRVGLLHNMGNPAVPPEWEETRAAARSLGLQADILDVRNEGDLRRVFELAVQKHIDGLVVGADGLTQMYQQMIVEWVARNRMPAIFPTREFVEAGGLIAYAVNYPDLYFHLASFVDKIFKGTKPAELPVQQPTRFELVVNATAAKALALEIPPTLLVRADAVIE